MRFLYGNNATLNDTTVTTYFGSVIRSTWRKMLVQNNLDKTDKNVAQTAVSTKNQEVNIKIDLVNSYIGPTPEVPSNPCTRNSKKIEDSLIF